MNIINSSIATLRVDFFFLLLLGSSFRDKIRTILSTSRDVWIEVSFYDNWTLLFQIIELQITNSALPGSFKCVSSSTGLGSSTDVALFSDSYLWSIITWREWAKPSPKAVRKSGQNSWLSTAFRGTDYSHLGNQPRDAQLRQSSDGLLSLLISHLW